MQSHSGLLFLLCGLACLTGVGIVVFGFGSESAAAELGQATGRPVGTTDEVPAPAGAMTATEGVFRPSDRTAVVEAPLARPVRTSGLIRGDVTLTASTVDKISAITIRIVEAVRDDGFTTPAAPAPTHPVPTPGRGDTVPAGTERRPFTYQMTMPFDPHDGTPKFAIEDIPFSRYGYLVQVFANGLNGTEQTVVLDEEHPIADVLLGIHPGTPFTILLRDQDMAPLTNVEVTLTPEEHPPGRPAYSKVTDSFGAAVFDNVLRGPYVAHLGPMAQPIHPPTKVEVMANTGLTAQSKTIIVPKGEALVVNVYNAVGHGVNDIEVRLSSGSDVRYRELKLTTDWAGRAVFEHLVPGTYWLNVTDARYQPRTVPATVRAGEKPKDVAIHLRMR